MQLLLLSSKLGYQFRGFAEAARRLGAEVQIASDRCDRLDDPWRDRAIAVKFHDAQKAAARLVEAARERPADGILALGDRPIETAAHVAQALGIPYNSPEAAANCRSKLRQREVLRDAGLPVPEFFSFSLKDDLSRVLSRVKFPCVVKPHRLFASTGVVRADNAEQFAAAVRRVAELLKSPEIRALREPEPDALLVERYIPGGEVAVEGLLTAGRLRVLAIFDKPDPLEGPYFEETIYLTPSRLPAYAQILLKSCLESCVRALGLAHGPLHAEFRINEAGPWVLEIQPRPIGGLCARALRFIAPEGEAAGAQGKIFLEELLVRHALGMPGRDWPREREASGVMMIPVPQSGTLERVEGVEEASRVPGVEEIEITARLHDYIAAWPEGSSYLGFIFARGTLPEEVEASLRAAHAKLRFTLKPRLPVEHPVTKRVQA
jgi:predicted ATP-grasp superfamily ATP-dependent carboligase